MALSQILCLDDSHVNPRTTESKPEFLYCEEQRLAIETLLLDGREAFAKQLQARGVRGFLSDLELTALAGGKETYDPGADLYSEDPKDEHTPLSLHYWPDMSDMSIPELDIGWPDIEAYRGVTRTTVHTQPPLEGQVHIKEVVRKMIAQAQKVIAVVMDLFTDADIFRDLLDASYKRKVSVYILLERVYIPHFLSMCQRASMHVGHLKNLRVRCSGGTEFITHTCTKVRGQMGHRFMFIDGDKAISGSYSFTWTSSRLDRNHVTVVTGQAVDTFDRLFRSIYSTSKLVDLRHVVTEPEPAPDPVPQTVSVALPSAAVARKLYNPKYALVAVGKASLSPSSSPGNNSPKESHKDTKSEEAAKKGRRRQVKNAVQEPSPLHPGLVDLEKVYLFDYLPIWPEPDPSSDVIGFINIRDTSKPTQVHLQRSEMFEVSQAIRFTSPISKQKETLPEVAKPRNLIPTQYKDNPPQQKTPLEPITQNVILKKSDKENAKSSRKDQPESINHTSPANPSPQIPRKSRQSTKLTTPSVDAPKTEAKDDTQTSTNIQSELQNKNDTERCQPPKLIAPSDTNPPIKIQNFSENTSTGNIPSAVSSTSVSANYQVSPATAVPSTLTSVSPILPAKAISTSASKPTANSPIETPPVIAPPIPKPRTVQLVFKDSPSKIPEVSIVEKVSSEANVSAVDNEPLVVTAFTQRESETVPERANKSARKSIPQKSAEDTAAKDCSQRRESRTSQEEPVADKGELQPVSGNKVPAQTNAPETKALGESTLNIHEEVTKKEEPGHVAKGVMIKTSIIQNDNTTDVPVKSDTIATVQNSNKTRRSYVATTSVPLRIIYSSSDENLDLPNSPNNRSPNLKPKQRTESTNKVSVEKQQSDTFPHDKTVSPTAKLNSHTPLLSPRGVPEKPTYLHLNNSQTVDSASPEKDSRILLTQRHSPILDGFPPRVPTPESRRSRTPDFRTPTSDISDGYGSTTSDEYYECNDSPFQEYKDQVPFYSLDAKDDREIHIVNSSGSLKERAATRSTDRTLSSSETLNSSTKGSLSSIPEKLDDEEKLTNEKAQIKRAEGNRELQEVQDAHRPPPKKSCKPAETEQTFAFQMNNEAAEAKWSPARELRPKRVYSRAERPDRLSAGGDRTSVGASGVERREEPEGHKQLAARDPGMFAQLRLANPSRPARPNTAPQPPLSEGDPPIPDGPSSSLFRRLPPRPPVTKTFPNQHHYRQPPTSPTKAKAAQAPNLSPLPKPQPSFLYTQHGQATQQADAPSPPQQNQAAAGFEEEKTPFGIAISKLYTLKGLREKMSKAQSRRSGGGGAEAQARKSTG